MNNSRNFTNDISNKSSFLSLKNEIHKKIKETLFDNNSLFLSSSFNEFCTNGKISLLDEEGKKLSDILGNLNSINQEEIQENNDIMSSVQSNPLPAPTIVPPINISKNISIQSEDEKSFSFESKMTKSSQIEQNKKYNLCLIKYTDLLNLLNINKKNKNIDNKEINTFDKKVFKSKINELKSEIDNNKNLIIKNNYLRKMVCLKLYKALSFSLKDFHLDKNDIQNICIYLEFRARVIDESMTIKYKEFIENIFKKVSS